MDRVIVTGANGFIGSLFVRLLADRGILVTAIDVAFEEGRIPEDDRITRIEMGLDDVDRVKPIISAGAYDTFYHFAWRGVNGLEKSVPSVQLGNIQMAMDCARLAKELNCRKFLCAGTVAEQSVKSIPSLEKTSGSMMYGVAKHCAHLMLETYCKNIGLEFIWMQFSNIYGIGNRTGNLVSYTLNELLTGQVATFGPANQPYDFIYVDDLLEAIYRIGATETARDFYFIGSGSPKILKAYLQEIGILCGRENQILIGVRPDDGIRYDFSMFDISPLTQEVGEYVRTSFDEGIQKTAEWLKKQQ